MSVKETLKKFDIFIYNNYFDLYCELIENNLSTKRQLYKTERHHIIPRAYFKKCGVENFLNQQKNSVINKDNIVNLLYKDHILAHYYLSMCSKDAWFKQSNTHAFLTMTFYTKLSQDEIAQFRILDKYQELYEEWTKRLAESHQGKLCSEETRRKLSIAHKGKKKPTRTESHKQALKLARDNHSSTKGKKSIYNKDKNIVKFVNIDEIENYLLNGWILGGKPMTQESKEKISKQNSVSLRGKKHIKIEGQLYTGLVGNKILCVELDKIFDNINEASDWLIKTVGIDGGHIQDCCKHRRETTGGYHWEYIKGGD